MKYIELFAGCGGLSLGLESISAKLMFANELSPMAAETYAFNFFGEDLTQPRNADSRVKWLSSLFSEYEFQRRLRENPYHYPAEAKNSDIERLSDFDNSLIVGDIRQLNKLISTVLDGKHPSIDGDSFRSKFCDGQVDLISGGPPCQSFSMAGMRELSNQRNTLPWEFAKFVSLIQPKSVLLENVQGILNAFVQNGEKFFAWFEVAKAFAAIGYVPICMLVNARFVGVAQNRPRYVMLALKADLALDLATKLSNAHEQEVLNKSICFFNDCQDTATTPTNPECLGYTDLTKLSNHKKFTGTFLSNLFGEQEVSVKAAIDDLKLQSKGNRRRKSSSYRERLSSLFWHGLTKNKISNHEMRSNTPKVKRRFHLYQTLRDLDQNTAAEVKLFLKGEINSFSNNTVDILSTKLFIGANEGEWIQLTSNDGLVNYLSELRTKKQTQKALDPVKPAPATLSIPDDACHYDELRTLSVREMARIQSFPDEFEFRSKVTTGGTSRRFEVPQYTQVGNAVPPLLGRALGLTVASILARVGENVGNKKPDFEKSKDVRELAA